MDLQSILPELHTFNSDLHNVTLVTFTSIFTLYVYLLAGIYSYLLENIPVNIIALQYALKFPKEALISQLCYRLQHFVSQIRVL